MTFHSRTETFAGLPVTEFPADGPPPAVTGPVAWRLGDPEADEAGFRARLDRLAGTIGAEVTTLVIGSWGYAAELDAPIEHLCALAPRLPGLRALFLGDITFDECEISWMRVGDVSPLLTAFPLLETLQVRGGEDFRFSPVRHEHLSRLVVESGGLPRAFASAVLASELPALTDLELWFGVSDYGCDIELPDLAALLAGRLFPRLRRLGLRNAEIADRLALAVAGAPVVARLESVDLSMGTLGDQGVHALLAGRPLDHLHTLDLHHHFMTPPVAESVVAALPGVRVDVSDRLEPRGSSRYTAVSE